jgi:ABC-type multidrug transport system ATPase subunit
VHGIRRIRGEAERPSRAIEVRDVGVVAGDVTLLPPVSVVAQRGEALVVRGRNGTGKSTLLRVLAGVSAPSTGVVRVCGAAVAPRDTDFRRRVAPMIGLPPLAPDLTVVEHILLVAATWERDPGSEGTDRVARDLLTELGIEALSERFPHELSSGQTQLFGLALVLARRFEVLILDEPEQRLDPEHLELVIRALRSRRDRGATLVVATHDPLLAEALADRTLLLEGAAA